MGAFALSLPTYLWRATRQQQRMNLSLQLIKDAESFPSRSSSTITTQSRNLEHQITGSVDCDFRRWNKTISLLIRTGRLNEARWMFDEMPYRNVVTWNSMLSGYVRQREIVRARELFDAMPVRDTVSWNVMISGYVACMGRGHVEEAGRLFYIMPARDTVSWNTMISGYARIGRMEDALNLFRQMPGKNVISWNAIITGFLQNGDIKSAVKMFERMPTRDSASLSGLISGLIQNGKLDDAADILLKIEKTDRDADVLDAYNTLIAGYGQRGRVYEARRLFDQIPTPLYQDKEEDKIAVKKGGSSCRFERNIISWNSMIMCYAKAGDMNSARLLFNEMPFRDLVSWNTMINGYVHASELEEAASLFHEMPDLDIRSWNAMISGYAQRGELELAKDFFERMPQKSLVSWNSMIAGYEQNGHYEGAMGLFFQMQTNGEKPDKHTLSSVLSACAGLTALYQGMQIHQCISKTLVPDIPINNSLVTMYARCGNITDAKAIFDHMGMEKDVVSWNAMIGGYAQHGLADKALKLFGKMKGLRVQPTYITFISVLNACAHAGLVAEARKQFHCMVHEFGIAPRVEHFASLVDVIGRYGQVKDAMEVIKGMPVVPDKAVWGALLGACRVHNDINLARIAAEALMTIEPESSAPYVLLHNMYVEAGRWADATEVRMLMETNKIKKQSGCSWIELHSNVHLFVAGGRAHPHADDISSLIVCFDRVMKDLDLDSRDALGFEGEMELKLEWQRSLIVEAFQPRVLGVSELLCQDARHQIVVQSIIKNAGEDEFVHKLFNVQHAKGPFHVGSGSGDDGVVSSKGHDRSLFFASCCLPPRHGDLRSPSWKYLRNLSTTNLSLTLRKSSFVVVALLSCSFSSLDPSSPLLSLLIGIVPVSFLPFLLREFLDVCYLFLNPSLSTRPLGPRKIVPLSCAPKLVPRENPRESFPSKSACLVPCLPFLSFLHAFQSQFLYPFLYVDRVIEYNPGVSAVAIKNVTINDNFFPEHLPERPIMLGVLIVELVGFFSLYKALAPDNLMCSQKRGPLARSRGPLDKARFRKPVMAGDTLVIRMTLVKQQKPFSKLEGKAYVGGQVACEGEFLLGTWQLD
ncbi:hypothetical protein ACLOJK_016191 [Asimina triloba]